MKARVITRAGSFTTEFYAIEIEIPDTELKFILQITAIHYPQQCSNCKSKVLRTDEYYNEYCIHLEGLCPKVKEVYQKIVDKINR